MDKEPNKKINIKVVPLRVGATGAAQIVRIESSSNYQYDNAFNVILTKPLSLQTGKTLFIKSGITVSTPYPKDREDKSVVVYSPYHIEWKVEPCLDLLMEKGILAYGSSKADEYELKLMLLNFGGKMFNAVAGDIIATLQFYLVPNLQIEGLQIL